METKLMEENESVDDTLEEGDDDTTEQGSENKLNQSRDEMDVEPVDMKATDVSSENVESQTNSDLPKFIKIPPRHPLFGVWEGHFSLPSKNSDGTVYEELVEESFFFYAFEGDSEEDIAEPGLRQLPYPPRWTAAYIRELHIAHRRDNGMEENQECRHTQLVPSAECVAYSPRVGRPPNTPKNLKKEVSFDTQLEQDNSNRDEASSVTEEVTSTESKKTTSQSEVKVNLQENSEVESKKHYDDNVKAIGSIEDTKKNSNSVNTGPVSHSTTETETVIESTPSTDISTSCTSQAKSAPRFTQQQATPNASLLIPPQDDGEVMIVGFGKNQYGRFSLAGAYNPRTGSLRCERKYMVTRPLPPVKHSPRATGEVGLMQAESGRRPVRAKRSLSIDSFAAVEKGPDSTKRKRQASQWLNQGGNELMGNDDGSSDASSAVPSKRGRKKGQTNGSSSRANQVLTATQYLNALATVAEKDGYRRAFLDPCTGEVYEGEWCNGQRNGFGIVLFPDGTMYEGPWLNNKEHGAGGLWMTGNREILYSGEWSEGRMHGSGTYYFPSGDIYVGEFKEGARHGKGRYTTADGITYEGDWKENARHGRGVFLWTDGSEYDGDWEMGQRSGRGELHLSNNLSYSGTWAGNLMEGRGVLMFPDGQEYKGMFKNGLREGRGSLSFPEGAIYEGRFREDALDGQGTLKITKPVPGGGDDETFIPLDNLADIRRIHYKSGFGGDSHH